MFLIFFAVLFNESRFTETLRSGKNRLAAWQLVFYIDKQRAMSCYLYKGSAVDVRYLWLNLCLYAKHVTYALIFFLDIMLQIQ